MPLLETPRVVDDSLDDAFSDQAIHGGLDSLAIDPAAITKTHRIVFATPRSARSSMVSALDRMSSRGVRFLLTPREWPWRQQGNCARRWAQGGQSSRRGLVFRRP